MLGENSASQPSSDPFEMNGSQVTFPSRPLKHQVAVEAEEWFRLTGYYGAGARAIRRWREAGEPEEGLRLAPEVLALPMPDKERASVKTSQGGCYKDVGKLTDAEACGLEATRLNPDDDFPHRLLWSVHHRLWKMYGRQENRQKAEEHLRKAEELSCRTKTVKGDQLM
jgi:tetratricopeptide (TPR) repeat protein